MEYLQALLLAIVEGITEFLPISSTGHLVLTSHLLKIQQTEFVKTFEIVIQSGAILAVVVLYFTRLWESKKLWMPLIIAFLPTGILGFFLYKTIKMYLLGNVWVTIIALFFGGIALIIFEKYFKPKENGKTIEELTFLESVFIGLAQSVSMIPGVSRAAATILGGMTVGLSRSAAVEFSFLLAIPTMFAATGYDLLQSAGSITTDQFGVLGFGFIASFFAALLAVKWFVSYVQTNSLAWFGVYRIVIALLFWMFLV